MRRIALIGYGAIGHAVLAQLQRDVDAQVCAVVVHEPHVQRVAEEIATIAPLARVVTRLNLDEQPRPDLLVECAGHAALVEHVLPALAAGVSAVVASTGALHDNALVLGLTQAAESGGAQVQLVSGAIGAVDVLAAAKLGGLSKVQYIGRKPPAGWRGTPAEQVCDLDALRGATTVFEGSAREAARLFPKNANVAATVSLAGLGLDATQATLVADPGLCRNVHRLVAEGSFGRLDMTIENEPLAANPKTSALTVYSIVRAIHNASRPLAL